MACLSFFIHTDVKPQLTFRFPEAATKICEHVFLMNSTLYRFSDPEQLPGTLQLLHLGRKLGGRWNWLMEVHHMHCILTPAWFPAALIHTLCISSVLPPPSECTCPCWSTGSSGFCCFWEQSASFQSGSSAVWGSCMLSISKQRSFLGFHAKRFTCSPTPLIAAGYQHQAGS